ncbi:MAG: U32 family peptidase [Proteobacteria bacterium]|nr:U32 family peptidase [Pseudomonadota bacterium]
MQPEAEVAGDLGDFAHRIDRAARCRAERRHNRDGSNTSPVSGPWTTHAAIQPQDETGKCSNTLSVEVGDSQVRFLVNGETGYAIEEPTSLNTLPILPDLLRIGVAAIKIEGRQRSPAYVAKVTRVLRAAIDSCLSDPDNFLPDHAWLSELTSLSEGVQTTLGAYQREWQ